jgi:hypothetical protein
MPPPAVVEQPVNDELVLAVHVMVAGDEPDAPKVVLTLRT